MERDLKKLVASMTLEEKAGMCSGADFWNTKAVERLGIPGVMMSDGPHGIRKQEGEADHLGLNESVEAVCFPAACATASSFDVDLIRQMGEILGEECQAEDLSMLLGPAVNIKRSPLCGRNFEFFGRSLSYRKDGSSLHQWRAELGCRNEYQAFRSEQPGVQKNVCFFRSIGTCIS